jgi:hypothetical protein
MKPIHLLSVTVLLLAACKESPQAGPPRDDAASSAEKLLLESVLNSSPNGEAKSIRDVKATAKPGDEVTLTGRVMGNLKPFVDGRAAFILADPSLITACSDQPGDGCETPWDACCNTKEEKTKAIATIQIVNAEGRVLKQAVEGAGGIAKLASLNVSGTVAEGSSGQTLIVNAKAIRHEKSN